ncbi:MAG: NfeD family protein [Succinivibrionaceae bacterium]|nr:NfeD family protein [Succinivibrionaceae bacterium]
MIDSFMNYVNGLNFLQLCLFCSMVGGGLLFLIEVVISTIGGGMDGAGADGVVQDLGTSDYAFRFFSLFSVSAFLFCAGCFGLWTYSASESGFLAALVALVSGAGAAALVTFLKRSVLKLQTEGNVRLENAVGKEAIVYLKIPSGGRGQIEMTLQGRKKFLAAISDEKHEIPTGSRVTVKAVSSGVLVVQPAEASAGEQQQ